MERDDADHEASIALRRFATIHVFFRGLIR